MVHTRQTKNPEYDIPLYIQKIAVDLINVSPVGIFCTDEEGHCTYVNQRWSGITGLTIEDARGEGWINALHPDDRDRISRLWYQSAHADRLFDAEYRFIHPDGKISWVKGVATASRGQDNKLIGFVGAVTDITELKLTEQQLKESQRAFFTLINNLPGMVYRCKNDPDWTLEFANEGCRQLIGYPSSDLIQKKVNYAELIYPDDRDRVWDEVQQGVEEKKHFQLTYRIRSRDGKEKWVWEQGQGVFSPEGELLALEGFITDITEQKHTERELREIQEELEYKIDQRTLDLAALNENLIKEVNERSMTESALLESEKSYQTLAKNLPGIVYRVFMTNGRKMHFFNEMVESITGYSEGEIDTIDMFDNLIIKEDRIPFKAKLSEAIKNRKPFEIEYRIRCKNNNIKYLMERGRPVLDDDNELSYIDGVIFEINSRKKA